MSSWTAASSDCSRPVNNYVHVKTADLYRPNARLTPERQGYQVLTPFGKLGYSPKDAIHVATALKRDVAIDQLDTFDEPLMRLSGKLGNPPLIIGKPNVEATLPLFEEDDSLEPTEPSTSTEPPPPSSQSDDDE